LDSTDSGYGTVSIKGGDFTDRPDDLAP